MVVAGTDAEMRFLNTTRQCEVMVLSPTHLLDLLEPVGVVVVHLILGETGIVVDFRNIAGCITHRRIEVLLLEQHGVLIAIEHLIAVGLVGARQTQAVSGTGGAACTALGLDFDYTVGTL